jgi:hypothetical protein
MFGGNHLPPYNLGVNCTWSLSRLSSAIFMSMELWELLSSICYTWTPVLGVKQSDITHITLAFHPCFSQVSPFFHLLGPHDCSSFLVEFNLNFTMPKTPSHDTNVIELQMHVLCQCLGMHAQQYAHLYCALVLRARVFIKFSQHLRWLAHHTTHNTQHARISANISRTRKRTQAATLIPNVGSEQGGATLVPSTINSSTATLDGITLSKHPLASSPSYWCKRNNKACGLLLEPLSLVPAAMLRTPKHAQDLDLIPGPPPPQFPSLSPSRPATSPSARMPSNGHAPDASWHQPPPSHQNRQHAHRSGGRHSPASNSHAPDASWPQPSPSHQNRQHAHRSGDRHSPDFSSSLYSGLLASEGVHKCKAYRSKPISVF